MVEGHRPLMPAPYRNRDVVGRSSACLKRWRRLAARSDKLAIVYRAAVVVSAIRRLRR
ncbi:transposase [Brevibacterium luteolum]|nr:transposase [Brevibacterium luteolum]